MPEKIEPTRVAEPLPCSEGCKFGKDCASKFKDGTCLGTVKNFFTHILECEPKSLGIENGKLTFILLKPYQKGTIEEGWVNYLNAKYIKR